MAKYYFETPKKQFTRKELRDRFRLKISRKEPVIIGTAGIGLMAKMEEIAGIDMIVTCNADYFRMDGQSSVLGYLGYGDANTIMLRLGRKAMKMARSTPIIGGVGSGDPYRDIEELLDSMIEKGFSGVINSPAAAAWGNFIESELQGTHLSFSADVFLISCCNRKNIFSLAYAFDEQQARELSAEGADVIVAHMGITTGGLTGAPVDSSISLDNACNLTQRIFEYAKKSNPDVFVVCHGGPLNSPESVQVCFERTDVQGFLGASAIDRISIEESVMECTKSYKALRLEKLKELREGGK